MRLLLATVLLASTGCAQLMPAPKQEPFPLMEVKAEQPPPGPGRVVLTASNIAIMDKVQFETGKADLKEVSFTLLDEVAAMLKDNPQVELISVEGHTDSTGGADFNRKLSQQRAESVAKYLAIRASRRHAWSPRASVPTVRSRTTRPTRAARRTGASNSTSSSRVRRKCW